MLFLQHFRCQYHRQMALTVKENPEQGVIAGVVDTVEINLSPVSTTPKLNLSPVTTTPTISYRL
jgi:hypothetical protein